MTHFSYYDRERSGDSIFDLSPYRDIPPEIFENVARYLVADEAYWSCASLSAVSRSAFSGCLPVLYHTVDWTPSLETVVQYRNPTVSLERAKERYRAKFWGWVWSRWQEGLLPGARFTRYLKLPANVHIGVQSPTIDRWFSLHPRLRAVVRSDPVPNPTAETLIDLAPGFRYGSNDWRELVPERTDRGNDIMTCLDDCFGNCAIQLDLGQIPRGETVDLSNVFGDVISLLYYSMPEFDNPASRQATPAHVIINSVSFDDAHSFIAFLICAMDKNDYYATLNLTINCVGPGTEYNVQIILQMLFVVMCACLDDVAPWELGTMKITFPALNNLSGTISVQSQRTDEYVLILQMQDNSEFWIVDRQLLPFVLEEDTDNEEEAPTTLPGRQTDDTNSSREAVDVDHVDSIAQEDFEGEEDGHTDAQSSYSELDHMPGRYPFTPWERQERRSKLSRKEFRL